MMDGVVMFVKYGIIEVEVCLGIGVGYCVLCYWNVVGVFGVMMVGGELDWFFEYIVIDY